MESILILQSKRENLFFLLASIRDDLNTYYKNPSDNFNPVQALHSYDVSLRELKILDQKIGSILLTQRSHHNSTLDFLKRTLKDIKTFTVDDLPKEHFSMFR